MDEKVSVSGIVLGVTRHPNKGKPMTKSLAFYDFLGLYSAMLDDIALYHPSDRVEWDRDITTLTHLYRTRGQSVFTIDLPALGKLLDRSLADQTLSLTGNFSRRSRKGSTIPRLFQGLWSRLFDNLGCLKSDIDPNDVLFLRTLLYVGKNLEWDCAPRYLFEATKEYFDVEEDLPPSDPIWDTDGSALPSDLGHLHDLDRGRAIGSLFEERDPSKVTLFDSIQRTADRIATEFGTFEPDSSRFRHGPGAVSDLPSGSYKYEFPAWSPRLEYVFPYDRYGLTSLGIMDRLQPMGLEQHFTEMHSELIDVPKTQKGPRLIAKEPTCHQWTQQCVRDFLYTRVAETFLGRSIKFDDQRHNQEGARLGSLGRGYSTLDLKSASDRLSTQLVQRVFRRNRTLLSAFIASRTRYLHNGIDKKSPELVKLRKFSTQGSALTFPVQSIVFLAICLGVGSYLNPRARIEHLVREVRVFGDDLIVPDSWADLVKESLSRLFLKVNDSKSFCTGRFRESCGADMWDGYDVTPPHVTMRPERSNPRTVASCVAVSNNFFRKGFWRTADWMRNQDIPKNISVVSNSSGMFGFHTFMKTPEPTRKRWNKYLHVDEFRILTVIAKSSKRKSNTAGALLQFFTEEPDPFIDYESGIAQAGVPVFQHTWVNAAQLGTMPN